MTEENTETTQDMDVNSEIHDELLDTLTDDFFQEDLDSSVDRLEYADIGFMVGRSHDYWHDC